MGNPAEHILRFCSKREKKAMISLDINWETSEVLRSKDTLYSNMKHSCIKMFIFSTGSGHYVLCSTTVKNQKMMKKLTKDFQWEQSRFTAISNITTPVNMYYSAIRRKISCTLQNYMMLQLECDADWWEGSPVSCRYWKCPVRRSSELCSVFGDGEGDEDGGGWVSQAFPLEQLPAESLCEVFRYVCRCSSTRFKQVRCSWPQKIWRGAQQVEIQCQDLQWNITSRKNRWHERQPSWCENTYVNNYSLFFYFQHRKRSNQGYRRHCHFILSNITQHNLHPPYLAMAFPFPCFIKEELAGVWTQDPESLSQKHFTHGAACRLTHHSLVCKGWDMTKL